MRLVRWLNKHLPPSLYLGFLTSVLGRLYRWGLAYRLNQFAKNALSLTLSPRWVSELYQLTSIATGLALLAFAPTNPTWLVVVIAVYCAWRLQEILVFALHWIFVAKDPVKSFRRSLVSFLFNVGEVAVFASVLMRILGCSKPATTRGQLLYDNLVAIFSFSLPESATKTGSCGFIPRLEVAMGWLLLLIVLTVVVSGISRGEHDQETTR